MTTQGAGGAGGNGLYRSKMIPQRWHSASASYSKEHLGQDEVMTEDMVIVRSCDSGQFHRKPHAKAKRQETRVFQDEIDIGQTEF